jgi:hypothetical protein
MAKKKLMGYDKDELEDLLETAVWTGLEDTITRAQRNSQLAQEFLSGYRAYYLGEKPLSEELCNAGTAEILTSLKENPYDLHPTAKRWATWVGAGALAASPFALIADPLYAGGALLISAGGFVVRHIIKTISAREAEDLKNLISGHQGILRKYIAESREYMGHELMMYGAIEQKDIRSYPAAKQDLKARSRLHSK